MDSPPERPARRYPYGCASALTAVGTIVLFVVLTVARCSTSDSTPTTQRQTPAAPRPLTGSVVVGTDDRTLIYSPTGFCAADAVLSATEAADRVALTVSYKPGLSEHCASWGPYQGDGMRAVLTDPLRGRKVVDALTGAAIPVFHGDEALQLPLRMATPSPTSPLDEWIGPTDIASATADFGGPGAATIAQRRYGIDAKTRTTDGAVLVLIATTGTWNPDPSTPIMPVTVRGRPGRAAPGIVVWTENGLTFAVRIDFPQHDPRPTAQLLALAALLQTESGTIP